MSGFGWYFVESAIDILGAHRVEFFFREERQWKIICVWTICELWNPFNSLLSTIRIHCFYISYLPVSRCLRWSSDKIKTLKLLAEKLN